MRRFVMCICLLAALAAPAASAEVAIIVNKSVPMQTIDSRTLFDLYSGDVKRWSNGQAVVLLDLEPRGDVKTTFYDYLGKSSSRMKSIWMKNMLAGEGSPPEAVPSEAELVKRVAATPGAIGYVSRPTVTGADDGIVTLIVIDPSKEK
jgi:ABC-type phosphate transport system substrate-binding protein